MNGENQPPASRENSAGSSACASSRRPRRYIPETLREADARAPQPSRRRSHRFRSSRSQSPTAARDPRAQGSQSRGKKKQALARERVAAALRQESSRLADMLVKVHDSIAEKALQIRNMSRKGRGQARLEPFDCGAGTSGVSEDPRGQG